MVEYFNNKCTRFLLSLVKFPKQFSFRSFFKYIFIRVKLSNVCVRVCLLFVYGNSIFLINRHVNIHTGYMQNNSLTDPRVIILRHPIILFDKYCMKTNMSALGHSSNPFTLAFQTTVLLEKHSHVVLLQSKDLHSMVILKH